MVANVGGLRTAIRRAELAADEAKIYQSLRARLTYRPQTNRSGSRLNSVRTP
jgi:glycosyltransferase A (GT-A) superfamily protein (DUF2064 family)